MKLFHHLSMAQKFLFLSALTALFPLSFFVFFSYRSYSRAMDSNLSEMSQNVLSLIEKNVQYTINDVRDTGNIILTSNDVQSVLSSDPLSPNFQTTTRTTEDLLINLTNNKQYIGTILLTNHKYSLLKSKNLTYLIENPALSLEKEQWIPETLTANGRGCWFSSNATACFSDNVLIYTKLIRSLNHLNPIGILLIGIDKQVFEDLLSPVQSSNHTRILIWHPDGILYDSAPSSDDSLSSMSTEDLELFFAEDGIKRISPTERVSVESILCANTNWHISAITPYNALYLDKHKTLLLFIFVAFVTLLVALTCSFLFTDSITKTIRQLQHYVENLKHKEKEHIRHFPDDEIGRIGNEFIHVVEENEKLTTNLYKSLYQEKEAELIALQSQINPHFLYNALDSIFWMAEEHNATDISRMTVALSSLFKLSLNNGEKLITVREELAMVHNYLTVQEIRFEDKIHVDFEIDDSLLELKIMKFILQPLVENSIQHGLSCKETGGSILIQLIQERTDLLITVIDDGIGFEADGDSLPGSGYALKNIEERLKLYYGPEYGITISSSPGVGTRVEVKVKIET